MRKIQLLAIAIILLCTASYTSAQDNKFKVSEKSHMLIEGTSNLRDWGVEIPVIKGDAAIDAGSVESFAFTIKVNDMKGTVSGMMEHVKKHSKPTPIPKSGFRWPNPENLKTENRK